MHEQVTNDDLVTSNVRKFEDCSKGMTQWLHRWTCDWRSRGSIPVAALASATLDKLFTHIVQRLWCYNLMALYKSV